VNATQAEREVITPGLVQRGFGLVLEDNRIKVFGADHFRGMNSRIPS
jgi:hypothetical protein